MVETHGLIPAIEAADSMVKAAQVTLIGVEKTDAALMTVKVVGETGAVIAAVAAGVAAAEKVGKVASSHVIPRPDGQMAAVMMPEQRTAAGSGEPASYLESLTVEELRRLARGQSEFPLQGREISRATKESLLKYFRENS
jgi:microcompartment protein CcmL/EutN